MSVLESSSIAFGATSGRVPRGRRPCAELESSAVVPAATGTGACGTWSADSIATRAWTSSRPHHDSDDRPRPVVAKICSRSCPSTTPHRAQPGRCGTPVIAAGVAPVVSCGPGSGSTTTTWNAATLAGIISSTPHRQYHRSRRAHLALLYGLASSPRTGRRVGPGAASERAQFTGLELRGRLWAIVGSARSQPSRPRPGDGDDRSSGWNPFVDRRAASNQASSWSSMDELLARAYVVVHSR